MTQKEIRAEITSLTNRYLPAMKQLGKTLLHIPETGYNEFRTAETIRREWIDAGLNPEPPIDIPLVRAVIETGRSGPTVALLAEMDALPGSAHPDSREGRAHSCGHHTQAAVLSGVARALRKSRFLKEELCGRILLMALPAEEYVEIEERLKLREEGKIRFLGGKQECLARGLFDDADIAVMIHPRPGGSDFYLNDGCNGFDSRTIRFKGKAAHAGSYPHKGINALNAVNIALTALNSLRETFREEDRVRLHHIVTRGGESVNIIPAEAAMEMFIRAASPGAVAGVAAAADRCLLAGALAAGAGIEISGAPGYAPLRQDEELVGLTVQAMEDITIPEKITRLGHLCGSTDMGDVSLLMPAVHPYAGGVEGELHAADFRVTDADRLYRSGCQLLLLLTARLLGEGVPARRLADDYRPLFADGRAYAGATEKRFFRKELRPAELLKDII